MNGVQVVKGFLIAIGVVLLLAFFMDSNHPNEHAVPSVAPYRTYEVPQEPSTAVLPLPSIPSFANSYTLPIRNYRGGCSYDCSGHDAGYEWAERNGIETLNDCAGNSNSFIEGCESYVEENAEEKVKEESEESE